MKISQTKATKIFAIIIFVLMLLFYFVLCPKYVPDITTFGVSPQVIPNLCFITVAVLSVGLFFEAHTTEVKNKKAGIEGKQITFDKKGLILTGYAFFIMVLYQIIVYKVHYIATVAVILAVSMYLFGQKNKIVIACVSIIVPVAYWCFFTFLLKMQMP